MKFLLSSILLSLIVSSCTFSGGTDKNNDAAKFITGAAIVGTAKDVHVINMIRAIGAPHNSLVIGKYKYYQWKHNASLGISTLFGGGSTSLYCDLTAETQSNKIKLINWYGNQCGIFLDPMREYFENNLNIAVITDEDEKKQGAKTGLEDAPKIIESGTEVLDLRQKTHEQKAAEKNIIIEQRPDNVGQNAVPIVDFKQEDKARDPL